MRSAQFPVIRGTSRAAAVYNTNHGGQVCTGVSDELIDYHVPNPAAAALFFSH